MKTVILTDEQEHVVSLRDGSFLVLAPPGTGKTEVIAQRIIRLLADSPAASFRALALTFNNRAAAAMRRRVRERLRQDTWRATVETYHSFYLDILRHYGHLIGIPPEVTVYDTVDSRIHALRQGLMEEGFVLTEEELDRQEAERALDDISRMKRALVTPAAAPTRTTGLGMSLREAYEAYEGTLRRNGAVDFDGMLTRTYELLTEHPQVADHYRRMYRYILVDEAQDTSTVQFEILRTICGDTHRNVFMVADPDQLINRWMGADRKNLDRFVSEFGAKTFRLSANFRCADRIVEAANRLLARGSKVPPIVPSGRAPGAVLAASYADERVEAEAVVDWVCRLRDEGLPKAWLADVEETEIPSNQLAVLPEVVCTFARSSPPSTRGTSRTCFEQGTWDRSIQRFTARHSMACEYSRIRDLALRRTLLGAVGQELDETSDALEIASAALPQFLAAVAERDTVGARGLIACLASASDVGSAMSVLTEPLGAEADESDLAELLRADRELLASRWSTYRNSTESRNFTWSGVVMSILDAPREDPDGIRVSTVHAAKGLEFRAVAIVGMNDGSFPDFRSTDDPDELASERRLAYVAATRASRALLLTRPRARATRYGARGQTPSRFLEELGVQVEDF